MEKISRFVVIRCVCVIVLSLCVSCHHSFYHQVKMNHKFSKRIYKQYLNKYGNASMLSPMGNFSVVWYYQNERIHIIDIKRGKIFSQREFQCDSIPDIKKYKFGCYPECLDAYVFESSLYDKSTDSLYHIDVCLDIHTLMETGSDCPVIKELREHIIKYKLRDL